jgi:ubiquinone/menaquinone biosynthesis C-methylase UbiE
VAHGKGQSARLVARRLVRQLYAVFCPAVRSVDGAVRDPGRQIGLRAAAGSGPRQDARNANSVRHGCHPPWLECLDLGSGSGDITFEIARRVGPTGQVTGVDMDVAKLNLASSSAAELGLANVEFRSQNLTEWHEVGTYDLVYCGLVLQHVTDPMELLRRIWAAIRPGGCIVVEDADFDGLFCYPPSEGFDFYARNYRDALRLRGGDPSIGPKLYRYFLEAGIPRPQLRLIQRADFSGEGKTMAHSTLVATAEAIIAEHLATEAEVDAAVEDLARFTTDPTTLIGEPRIFQVWAQLMSSSGRSSSA